MEGRKSDVTRNKYLEIENKKLGKVIDKLESKITSLEKLILAKGRSNSDIKDIIKSKSPFLSIRSKLAK